MTFFINLKAIKDGYARLLIVYPDNKYASLFKKAEIEARKEKIGLWNK